MCIQPNATVFLGKLCYYHYHHVLLLVFLSLGQACNHVAALLFFIEHHASTKQDVLATEVSKTSKPMAWNQPPKKEVNPARAKDIKFVKPSHGDLQATDDARPYKRHDFDPRQPKHRVIDINSVTSLLEDIKESMPNTGLKQFWERNAIQQQSEQPRETFSPWNYVIFSHEKYTEFQKEFADLPTREQCYEYMQSMSLSKEVVDRIEEMTREQADSKLWHALRNGRLTSSRFGEILHRRQTTDPRRLVKDIMGYGKSNSKHVPPPIRWGRDNEPLARKCYLENRQAAGEDMEFESAGLSLLPEKCYLGASSDGRLNCKSVDTCCIGCLEIKCPYSIKGSLTITLTPDEIADRYGKDFFMKRGEDGLLHLPTTHPYYAQVQGELAVLNVEWCDFVVYSNRSVVVDRILSDFSYWTQLNETLDNFYAEHVVPEILCGSIFKQEYHL